MQGGHEGYGGDAAVADAARSSDLDVFGRKLAAIITADYTDVARAAGPLDIAGQVCGVHILNGLCNSGSHARMHHLGHCVQFSCFRVINQVLCAFRILHR